MGFHTPVKISIVGFAALIWAVACGSSNSAVSKPSNNCPVGSEGCPCTTGKGCDQGLVCFDPLCFKPNAAAGGQGGIDNFAGQGGGGVSSVGGGGISGGGTTSTLDGSVSDGAPPQPMFPICTTSTDCAADEVCALKTDGSGGYCLKGSGKDCTHGDVCVHAMGFDSTSGKIEGPACSKADDCNQAIEYQLNSVCVRDTSASGGTCVAVCDYVDDPTNMNCVVNPRGLFQECTRDQIRTVVWWLSHSLCVDQRVDAWHCKPNARPITPDEDWMLHCMEQSSQCAPLNCFLGSSSLPEAKLGVLDYKALLYEIIDVQETALPDTAGAGTPCGTDCDCGHCAYCESGSCHYGGEGPYGCYRGCK